MTTIWDRADFAAAATWREMEEFLKALEVRGPAQTPEQKKQDADLFVEIMQRQNATALGIFERASSGNPAPHLSVVRPEDGGLSIDTNQQSKDS